MELSESRTQGCGFEYESVPMLQKHLMSQASLIKAEYYMMLESTLTNIIIFQKVDSDLAKVLVRSVGPVIWIRFLRLNLGAKW